MNITAFDIYLVMQINSVRGLVGIVCFLAAILSAIILLCLSFDDMNNAELRLHSSCKKVFTVCLPLLVLSAFCPSGKTIAAMKVIPAIINNESVHGEAKELYDLAKQGLKELVTDKKED